MSLPSCRNAHPLGRLLSGTFSEIVDQQWTITQIRSLVVIATLSRKQIVVPVISVHDVFSNVAGADAFEQC